MTAAAFALEPLLDDEFVPHDGSHYSPQYRPQLRLIEGGGYGAAPPPSIEVVRRRRFFALLAVSMLIVGIAWATGSPLLSFSSADASPLVGSAPAVHVVVPGDSYAAIAAELGATNPVVAGEQLRRANGGGELAVGQRLVIDERLLHVGTEAFGG